MTRELQKTEQKMKTLPARCDIYKENDRVLLTLEMPGVDKDSLEIRVEGDRLIIDGKKNLPHGEGEFKIREIRAGDFHQEYTIDDTIDRNNIEASIKNGEARIILRIKEEEKPRKITIKVK